MIKKIIFISTIILSMATGAFAQNQCPYIAEGAFQNYTQYMVGDQECINYGTIADAARNIAYPALEMGGDNNLFTNEGNIYGFDNGVKIWGWYNTLINNGLITNEPVQGGWFLAISDTQQHFSHVTNNGQIITYGRNSRGISLFEDNTIVNNGDIFVYDLLGESSYGSAGLQGIGVANRNLITNMGHIKAVGGQWAGAFMAWHSFDNTLINGGTIEAQSFDGDYEFNDHWLDNDDPVAIYLQSVGPAFLSSNFKLVLLPTSIIMGKISFGASSLDPSDNDGNPYTNDFTLEIANGLSTVLTFERKTLFQQDGYLPGTIESNGALSSVNYDNFHVGVVDTTILSVVDEIVLDLSNNIKNSLYSHIYSDRKKNLWGSAFGGYRNQPGDLPSLDTKIYNGGLMGGMDWSSDSGLEYGFFIGGTYNKVDHEYGTQNLKVKGGFGGGYLIKQIKGFTFGLMGSAGILDHESERNVANNQNMETGLDKARADYLGTFFNAEISIARVFQVSPRFILTPSFHIGYAGDFTQSFSESGSLDDFQVDGRKIGLLNGRAQVEAHFKIKSLTLWGKTGIEGFERYGVSSVKGSLVGNNIDFDLGARERTYAAIAGIGWNYNITETLTFTGKNEASFINDGSIAVNGSVGLIWSY